MRMCIMTMVWFVVDIGEECRDLWLSSAEIQLQRLYELLRMFQYCALQIICPWFVAQANTGMGKIRAPYLILKDAEQFRVLDVFSVLFAQFSVPASYS